MEIKFVTTNENYSAEIMFMFNYFGEIKLVGEEVQETPVWADEWFCPVVYYNWSWKIKPGMEEPAKNYYNVLVNADLLA